jgi:hypothetical protein
MAEAHSTVRQVLVPGHPAKVAKQLHGLESYARRLIHQWLGRLAARHCTR